MTSRIIWVYGRGHSSSYMAASIWLSGGVAGMLTTTYKAPLTFEGLGLRFPGFRVADGGIQHFEVFEVGSLTVLGSIVENGYYPNNEESNGQEIKKCNRHWGYLSMYRGSSYR